MNACTPIANPCAREIELRAAGHATYNEITTCRQCSSMMQERQALALEATRAKLRRMQELLRQVYELMEGYEDGAPDASPTSKLANHAVPLLRRALLIHVPPAPTAPDSSKPEPLAIIGQGDSAREVLP